MIDRESRDSLAELLRHLVCGQMTNDDFADTADRFAHGSNDRAVTEIYSFADGLYDDLWKYRLRGPRRIADEQRRQSAIAAMFLYSDLEYEWPPFTSRSGFGDFFRLICAALAVIMGFFFFVGGFAVRAWVGPTVFLPASALCFAGIVWLYFRLQAAEKENYLAWCEQQNQFGDFDVWPFLRRADFERARKLPRLLTGGSRAPAA